MAEATTSVGMPQRPITSPDPIDPREADERYRILLSHAQYVAGRIVATGRPASFSSAGHYLLRQSRLLASTGPGDRSRSSGIAAEALDGVDREWMRIANGTVTGEEILAASGDIWWRLMTEWPMGQYARMAAEEVAAHLPGRADVVELGAGVGATTRLIRGSVMAVGGRLTATDKMYGTAGAVDFDAPLLGQIASADVVVATNALHCARHPGRTLSWIRELLPPQGQLVIAEGAPWPQEGIPWALNLVFGTLTGWYDRQGFRPWPYWRDELGRAGFAVVSRIPFPSERYDLGGVIHAWVTA
jgi:Methyltransferase domain